MFAETLAKEIKGVCEHILFFLLWFVLRRCQYTENKGSSNRMTRPKDEKLELI
jgi:hypothetical protein